MGRYLNPTNVGFQKALKSPIYVDKTGMIKALNQIIGTNEPMICVSEPRRFGKSMAVNMLTAYYSRGCDSKKLFEGLDISREEDFEEHLNRYDVIRLDMQLMMSEAVRMAKQDADMSLSQYIQNELTGELQQYYPECTVTGIPLTKALWNVYGAAGKQFIMIIDEWDSVFRNFKDDLKLQKEYINFLRDLFKGVVAEECIALAYITGILPVKKYGTESALNNFREYTMVKPKWMAEYVGFTEKEVMALSERYKIDFKEVKKWYDGYHLKGSGDIYNPRSVVETMLTGEFGSHWTSTETYESLKNYIMMDMYDLKSAVSQLIAGNSLPVNTAKFQNDMVSMNSRDDVLSLLIHLGYLGYDENSQSVFIPNEEVKKEFENAIEDTGWTELIHALTGSQKLLEDTWAKDYDSVAAALEQVHEENVAILNYNDENALAFVVSLAYYNARKDYILIRELPSGKGFADIVFLPRRTSDKPALVVELKWDKTAVTAIDQIKAKHYTSALERYTGKILLIGINYDKKTKKHQCQIEEYLKI